MNHKLNVVIIMSSLKAVKTNKYYIETTVMDKSRDL